MILVWRVSVSASGYQIQALDVLPWGEEIFLGSEKLAKLDTFIVGRLVFRI